MQIIICINNIKKLIIIVIVDIHYFIILLILFILIWKKTLIGIYSYCLINSNSKILK